MLKITGNVMVLWNIVGFFLNKIQGDRGPSGPVGIPGIDGTKVLTMSFPSRRENKAIVTACASLCAIAIHFYLVMCGFSIKVNK